MSQGIELQPRHLLPLQEDKGGDLTFQEISREKPVWTAECHRRKVSPEPLTSAPSRH